MNKVELTFEYQSVDPTDVLYTLDKCCAEVGLKTSDYSQAYQVEAIEAGSHLDLSGDLFTQINGGSIANYEHDFLIAICQDLSIKKLLVLTELIIDGLPATQAFVHDYDYYYWQNVEDLLLYESKSKDHSSLPKRSNDLPYPLEQTIVDVSKNPGRRVLRDGFRETVSSPMWIDEKLILSVSDLIKINDVKLSRHKNLLRIESRYETFTCDDGDQGDMQNRIRHAVYGT